VSIVTERTPIKRIRTTASWAWLYGSKVEPTQRIARVKISVRMRLFRAIDFFFTLDTAHIL